MSVPAYPEYLDSGVPWLGAVPKHWSLEALRGQFEELSDKNVGALDQNYLSLVAGRGVMPYAEKGDMGNKKPDDLEKCKIVKSGNFVINSMNFGIGAFGVSAHNGVCSPVYVVLEPIEPRSLRFLRWIFDNPWFREVAQSFGNGILAHRAAIGWDELKVMCIGVPPIEEQAAIAAFLDREAAKIDALVAEQERLIALLKEKRQAVICHAVTKGLNPDAPMKDSGIEWLGEIPAHWEVVPMKHLVTFRSGGTPSKDNLDFWNGEIPWASAKDLKTDVLTDTIDHLTQHAVDERAATLVPAGAVAVLVRGMMLARLFPVCELRVPMTINQDLKALLPSVRLNGSFLAWALRGTAAETLNRLDEAGHGTKALRMEAWTSMELPLPPLDEQANIVARIRTLTGAIDQLAVEAQAAITLLQERRAALISAAVTGKIDVRGLVDAPATAELETV